MFLDGESRSWARKVAQDEVRLRYDATLPYDRPEFTYWLGEATGLTGGMNRRLWVSVAEGDDMDIFAVVHKLDRDVNFVPLVAIAMLDDGPVALGWLRVSHRETDPELSAA